MTRNEKERIKLGYVFKNFRNNSIDRNALIIHEL